MYDAINVFEALGIVKKTRNLITYCSDDIVIKTSKADIERAKVWSTLTFRSRPQSKGYFRRSKNLEIC